MLYKRAPALLATNSAIVDDLREDGVTTPAFVTSNPIPENWATIADEPTRIRARSELGLDSTRPLVVYTGKLYPGMAEYEYLQLAAESLRDVQFVLTGGRSEIIGRLRKDLDRRGLPNMSLTGFLERPELAHQYQIAADVLVSYYSAIDHPYARHNLPNKLAEYMSTGNPVIVADFPAVRDLATPSNAFLVRPDAPDALVKTLRAVIDDLPDARRLATEAAAEVRRRSSEKIAEGLASFLAGRA